MGFVRALCPNCGANLSVDDAATSARCTYCDTTSRLQRRTRVFQLPIPAPGPPGPVAVQRISVAAVLVPLLLVVGVLGFSATMILRAQRGSRAAITTPAQPPAVAKAAIWFGDAALAADVDRDGVHDLIGMVHHHYKAAHLAAFSGITGARLWIGEPISDYQEIHARGVALAGETLVWADARAGLHAFELATGARRWQVTLGEPVKLMCGEPDPGRITIMTTDERWHTIALSDGGRTDASPRARPDERTWGVPPKLPPCARLPISASSRVDQAVVDLDSTAIEGMWIGHALVDAGRKIAIGHRLPGTYVPMVAQLADDKRAPAVWTLDVPDGDPFDAATGPPALAALTGDLLVVVHDRAQGSPMLTAIDAATGARRWVTPLAGEGLKNTRSGLTITPTAIVVSSTGAVQAIDHAGKPTFTIGTP